MHKILWYSASFLDEVFIPIALITFWQIMSCLHFDKKNYMSTVDQDGPFSTSSFISFRHEKKECEITKKKKKSCRTPMVAKHSQRSPPQFGFYFTLLLVKLTLSSVPFWWSSVYSFDRLFSPYNHLLFTAPITLVTLRSSAILARSPIISTFTDIFVF